MRLIDRLRILRSNSCGNLTKSSCQRNFASSSVFGDFQFKGREKSELKSSYDIVIVGAGEYWSILYFKWLVYIF